MGNFHEIEEINWSDTDSGSAQELREEKCEEAKSSITF